MSKHDKTKTSTGLLDMWFGRPKTKAKSYTANPIGGRPISADSESLTDPQDLHNYIMGLSHEEVDEKFVDILEDMNIPKDKRQPLLEKSLDEKRDMILMHLKGKLPIVFQCVFFVLVFVFSNIGWICCMEASPYTIITLVLRNECTFYIYAREM